MKNQKYSVIIIGAGPAGLTAAYELIKHNIKPIILEKFDKVGGISRTETYKDYKFDIGGHRFYTKVTEIEQLWQEVMKDDFIIVNRLSRIYYNGKFFNYPLEINNALLNLGLINSLRILISYIQAKITPHPEEENFEQWVSNRFGKRLYETFFKTYTEKVWGIPCTEIRADWAAQRIQGMSLTKAILNALFTVNNTKSMIKEFHYPKLGPGMMWERFQDIINEAGGKVNLNTNVSKIHREGNHIQGITINQGNDNIYISGEKFISTMAINQLIASFDPPVPPEILQAALNLKYRDFLIVCLVIDQVDLFPDQWIYIHSPEFKVGRIQNFKNWSIDLVPDINKTSLGMEYFCSRGDDLWQMSNQDLINLASDEVIKLGFVEKLIKIEDAVVIRQLKAYPVYDGEYYENLQIIRQYLAKFDNLQTIGRNGMHRYNNQDHSMLTGLLAARNILGENHDLWEVNTERSYYEEFKTNQN